MLIAQFAVFHLSYALVFDIRWVTLTLSHHWLGLVNWLLQIAALYAPPIALLVFAALPNPKLSRTLYAATATATATAYTAWFWYYPPLTAFLYKLGQLDRFPTWLFAHMPGIGQYPPLPSG